MKTGNTSCFHILCFQSKSCPLRLHPTEFKRCIVYFERECFWFLVCFLLFTVLDMSRSFRVFADNPHVLHASYGWPWQSASEKWIISRFLVPWHMLLCYIATTRNSFPISYWILIVSFTCGLQAQHGEEELKKRWVPKKLADGSSCTSSNMYVLHLFCQLIP